MLKQPAKPHLSTVRRMEAAGFRAWPAASVHYDGAWLVRLTAAHPARRLNSINSLDPGDVSDIARRIGLAEHKFDAYGRLPVFRISPLTGDMISDYLDREKWETVGETLVMQAELEPMRFSGTIDQIPLKHVGRFVDATMEVGVVEPSLRAGLSEVIESIQPEAGLFVHEQDEKPVSTAICVHDNELAGLFEVATHPGQRGQGHGRAVVHLALKWARLRGAKKAWLQAEYDNQSAIRLYRSLGFTETYRYHYRVRKH